MSALSFPCTIFTTRKRMDDFGANDMRCGDLSVEQLKQDIKLTEVSDRVNPFNLMRRDYRQKAAYPPSAYTLDPISKQECINALYDEFRERAKMFSFVGPYRDNILAMINHMQHKKGQDFSSMSLDSALREQILTDRSDENSSRLLLKDALTINIDWENGYLPFKC